MSCIRTVAHGSRSERLIANDTLAHRKSFSEQGPEPLELSDVVWRACKAVEEADRPFMSIHELAQAGRQDQI